MAETHTVPVTDDESVVAIRHRGHPADRAASRPWFVCCHGFLSDKSGSYERRCQRAATEGYDAVRFDFRGCGESDGSFPDATLSSRIADLEAVLEYFDPSSVVLFGSSFGGTVAFHAAVDDDRIEAIATRAPVTYTRALANYRAVVDRDGVCRFDDETYIDARFFDDLDRYSFDEIVPDLTMPIAIVHGRDDDSVDVADSFEAARALETDVLLRVVPGEGHRFSTVAEERLLAVTFDWLERLDWA